MEFDLDHQGNVIGLPLCGFAMRPAPPNHMLIRLEYYPDRDHFDRKSPKSLQLSMRSQDAEGLAQAILAALGRTDPPIPKGTA